MTAQWTTGSDTDLRLILVRHATHADFGRRLTGRSDGASLTAAGAREARELAVRLKAERLTEVQTSPRARARDTAEAIGAESAAPVVVAPELDEIDFGTWTGAAFDALEGNPDWEHWNARRSEARTPGGESMVEAADRIDTHVRSLAETRRGERIALVTHSDMIRGLVARLLGLSLDNLLRFEIGPASITRVEAGLWGARVLSVNEPGWFGAGRINEIGTGREDGDERQPFEAQR